MFERRRIYPFGAQKLFKICHIGDALEKVSDGTHTHTQTEHRKRPFADNDQCDLKRTRNLKRKFDEQIWWEDYEGGSVWQTLWKVSISTVQWNLIRLMKFFDWKIEKILWNIPNLAEILSTFSIFEGWRWVVRNNKSLSWLKTWLIRSTT